MARHCKKRTEDEKTAVHDQEGLSRCLQSQAKRESKLEQQKKDMAVVRPVQTPCMPPTLHIKHYIVLIRSLCI